MSHFADKVVLVTGGRTGIGHAIARRFRDEGARVFTAQRGADSEFDSVAIDFADPVRAAEVSLQIDSLFRNSNSETLTETEKAFQLGFVALTEAIVVAIQIIAVYSRYMRSSLLDVLSSEYMRTARSKGISERRVLFKHGLRNALIPVVTIAALDVGAIVGGLIITENIFSYPGMGMYFLSAFGEGDFPLLMPWMVIIVASTLMFNLLADISYAWLDPRIRLE